MYHKNFIKSVEMMGTVLHCAGETITLSQQSISKL